MSITMLVGLTNEMYRCMNCGADLQQHINGKDKLSTTHNTRPEKTFRTFCKRMEDG